MIYPDTTRSGRPTRPSRFSTMRLTPTSASTASARPSAVGRHGSRSCGEKRLAAGVPRDVHAPLCEFDFVGIRTLPHEMAGDQRAFGDARPRRYPAARLRARRRGAIRARLRRQAMRVQPRAVLRCSSTPSSSAKASAPTSRWRPAPQAHAAGEDHACRGVARALSEVRGSYVPSLYEARRIELPTGCPRGSGAQADESVPKTVEKLWVIQDFDGSQGCCPSPSCPLTSSSTTARQGAARVQTRLPLQPQAGMIYRPARERNDGHDIASPRRRPGACLHRYEVSLTSRFRRRTHPPSSSCCGSTAAHGRARA